MSLQLLVTLFVLVSLASAGALLTAVALAWRDQEAARQHAIEQYRRKAAICRIQRQAEQRIDGLVFATLTEMAAARIDLKPPVPNRNPLLQKST